MNKITASLISPSEGSFSIEKTTSVPALKKHSAKMLSGAPMHFVHLKLKLSLLGIAMRCFSNPLNWIRSLRYLIRLRRKFLGDHSIQKMAYAGGKYYMGLYTPGWNSAVYKHFISAQLNDYIAVKKKTNRFNTVFMALTKKCALQCEHCFEWDSLNKKDILSATKLNRMVRKLQDKGVSQIQFSGGEPLLKMDLLLGLLKEARKTTDFWVLTSGFKLSSDNARGLKTAGLTGVVISLDHFDAAEHNRFRGFKDAYYWVEQGVKNALENDLVVALSLCATKEFISEENLMTYMNLAKSMGVSFVQLLEPRAVGHYAGKDVLLHNVHMEVLERFFERMNFSKAFKNYPIITYHGYYQRRFGCFSAGVKGMYVDTDGDMNACPFCHSKTGNVLDDDFDGNLESMRVNGCPTYLSKTS